MAMATHLIYNRTLFYFFIINPFNTQPLHTMNFKRIIWIMTDDINPFLSNYYFKIDTV